MADFRRKEYRGSLLLVQECGPVDIVVDTDAKTVTPSLAKADSSYSIAGGGGGSIEYASLAITAYGADNGYMFFAASVDADSNGTPVITRFEDVEEADAQEITLSAPIVTVEGRDLIMIPFDTQGSIRLSDIVTETGKPVYTKLKSDNVSCIGLYADMTPGETKTIKFSFELK